MTSYSELAREARATERWNRLHPEAVPKRSHVENSLPGTVPIVAASDYVRAYPLLIASSVPAQFTVLSTDGFGRSDTRSALRRFFEVSREHIVVAALWELVGSGDVVPATVRAAVEAYGIDPECAPPWLL